MPNDADVQQLVRQASAAPTLHEAQELVTQAEQLRSQMVAEAAQQRDVDLASAIVTEHLRPAPVYERHTAATDWIGEVDTSGVRENDHQLFAAASVWYSSVPGFVKGAASEFAEQARGKARAVSGAYGAAANEVESSFLSFVGSLHDRDVRNGVITLVAEQRPQVGEEPGSFPTETTESVAGMPVDSGLPAAATSSERSPTIQALERNESAPTDVTGVNDPGLGQVDTQVDRANGTLGDQAVADLTQRMTASRHEQKEPGMRVQCPTCGTGSVAARYEPTQPRQAYSGLPQITEIINNSDTAPEQTPLPTDVAFPLIQDPQGEVQRSIQTAEQQIAEREQRKGASSQQARHAARRWGNAQRVAYNAQQVRLQSQAAGYDASGWAGDMGAGGYGSGQQEPNFGGPNNLGMPDPAYGYGGDQPSHPIKPYGADEADDYTNNPGMNWQPGNPTQYDISGPSTQAAPAPGFPNAPKTLPRTSSQDSDPQLDSLLRAVRNRRAYLASQQPQY